MWEAEIMAVYEAVETEPINTFWREMLQLTTFNKFGGAQKPTIEA